MPGPDSSIGYSIRHESEGWGFESPSGGDIFVSKMNAVARAQLTFQMLTLFQIYMYISLEYILC